MLIFFKLFMVLEWVKAGKNSPPQYTTDDHWGLLIISAPARGRVGASPHRDSRLFQPDISGLSEEKLPPCAKGMPRERGSLTGSGVLHKQVNHVAQRWSSLGDGWKLPQDGFLNHLITWQAIQSQIVLLLKKIFSTWCETWNINTRMRKIKL